MQIVPIYENTFLYHLFVKLNKLPMMTIGKFQINKICSKVGKKMYYQVAAALLGELIIHAETFSTSVTSDSNGF